MKPVCILFVCIGNTCRSQMAEGFARHLGDGRIDVKSAGTAAYGSLVQPTIQVMEEKGIDIRRQWSKNLTDEMCEWADIVVSLCHHRTDSLCPPFFIGEKLDWEIFDPFGYSLAIYRQTRDEVEERVEALIKSLS